MRSAAMVEVVSGIAHAALGTLWAPLRAVRRAHLPILAIYAASGALGLIAVAESFWVKGQLTLSLLDLASIAVWLQVPWIAKVVVAELVEAAPGLRTSRRLSILIGAALAMLGLTLLAGAAGRWLTFATPEHVYVAAQLLIVVGCVVQEVVADSLVPSVVARVDRDGQPRSDAVITAELAMVEVLARMVYTLAALVAGGLAGVLGATLTVEQVYLVALAVPLLSVVGAFSADIARSEARAIDWRVLGGGGILIGLAAALGLAAITSALEIVFTAAVATLVAMFMWIMRDVTPDVRRQITTVAALAFAFRATPSVGDGYRWYAIDTLGFDEAFFGIVQVSGTALGLVLMWLLAAAATAWPVARVMVTLTICSVVLLLPMWVIATDCHVWTSQHLSLGPRALALVDEAAQSPLALLATVPLLALVAVHAPAGRRATWFAITASLMSLAIVAGQLISRALNAAWPVGRGAYDNLPVLVTSVVVLNLVMPLVALVVLLPASRKNNVLP